ncbi:MAG: outer membrane beta-barrel protein [Rhodomicrobium sp.]
MAKISGLFNLRREAACNENASGGMRKGWFAAAAVIGVTAMSSHGASAQSMKDGDGCDPYKNYSCLDAYLGTGVLERFFNYYRLEWGQGAAPADPNALPARVDGWPRTPATVPPMAYTEWPAGAQTSIGVTRPNSVDSPFMTAIADTDVGKWMNDNHLQLYGWVNPGFNVSTNPRGKGANDPIAYTYISNTAQFDQGVIYLERLPDTVQTDHIDWGFRLSGLYGTDYRYTNSYGVASWQFNGKNYENGYDFPMEYVDIYIPFVMQGLEFRIGRYISIPDIEAQLAPNNLTYTHSLTYGWDNYTNTGIVTSLQVTKNLMVQVGLDDGTETPLWHSGKSEPNLFNLNNANAAIDAFNLANNTTYAHLTNDPLFSGKTYRVDPGNQPSLAFCVQYKWNDGWDNFYPCIDGINKGNWGYNNIQWHGFTYYHRFSDQWHLDFEAYYLDEHDVLNNRNPVAMAIQNNGGTPFSPQNIPFNSTNTAYCASATGLTCDVYAIGVLGYLNYTPDPLNNFTLRLEWYDDPQGWRTGTAARYADTALSWQHWLSPQIEFRPEISFWESFDGKAFNGNPVMGIAGDKNTMVEFASDVIIHF